MVKERAKKMTNWTVPGKNDLHGFWLKHLNQFYIIVLQIISIKCCSKDQ